MKLSEKSLELNVGAELLLRLRTHWGLTKAYLRGLTQREEREEGFDFSVQLSPDARVFAFQFKRAKGAVDEPPYRYTLSREQHEALHELAQLGAPGSVFYVFPFYVAPTKLQQDLPVLAADTWLLDVRPLDTQPLFDGVKTRTVRCYRGLARINPEYKMQGLGEVEYRKPEGISAEAFARWYERQRDYGRENRKRRNPWLVRGLRIAIVAS